MRSAREIAAAVRAGERSPLEAAERSRIALRDSQRELRTAITIPDRLVAPAADALRGPLAGVPVLVKDLIDVEGMRTTYGSAVFAEHVPMQSAESVRRLQRAGAIVVGKANLHEFAWGLTSRNAHWGAVVNPRDPRRTPGGSSGGNAAAIAAGLVPIGLGTDTAGSLRIPAACCAVVGFKPANRTVPSDGVFPLARTLDCVGPMAASVDDCVLVHSVLAGVVVDEPAASLLRVAATDERLRSLLDQAGIEASLAAAPQPPDGAQYILPAEAWRTHRDLVERVGDEYDPNVLAKLLAAREVGHETYLDALDAVTRWRRSMSTGLDYDVIVTRTTGIEIPAADVDEIAIRETFGRSARWANLIGWAAMAVGNVQIVGPDAGAVFAVARAVERIAALPAPRSAWAE